MPTGIRNVDPESTREILRTFDELCEGPDGYMPVTEEHLAVIKNCIAEDVGVEAAASELEPIVAIEDCADAATDGVDEDLELDASALIGFTRSSNDIKRVTPIRFCAKEEQVTLIIGSLQVPVEQDGKTLKVGRLRTESMAEDYEKISRPTKDGEIHFHFVRMTDSESGDMFDVALYVRADVAPEAVRGHLKAGDPLTEILSAPGGGAAVRLNEFITAETSLPWTGEIATLNTRESDSPYAVNGLSFSVTLKSGETLYLRGAAEKEAAARREKIDSDLASGKGWQLKVTSRSEVDGKVRMGTKLVSSSRASLFSAQLAAATSDAAGELPAAKEEEAKPAAKRKNVFAKSK